MKRYDVSLVVAALLLLSGLILMTPAKAVPPTVTPSPGYDARLQEQRDASHPPAPALKPVHRRRIRRVHDRAR
jgi:hypothetical protein